MAGGSYQAKKEECKHTSISAGRRDNIIHDVDVNVVKNNTALVATNTRYIVHYVTKYDTRFC